MAIIHCTPGLIPIESFTMFGISAKEGLNPIGKFGTGLKYAVAILLRTGHEVRVFRGTTEYVFYLNKTTFRNKSFDYVRMKKRKGLLSPWSYEKLPFTTELGKTWELWQAFRELHANTLDEGGHTFQDSHRSPDEAQTNIIVRGDGYTEAYKDMAKTFLPDGLKVRNPHEPGIQVIDRPSAHIYFRGMRVMDLKHEAMFTYNFLQPVELTEDRTAKYPWIVEAEIIDMMRASQDTSFLKKAVATPRATSYEGSIGHTRHYGGVAASAAYIGAAEVSSNPTAKEVWNQEQPTVPSRTVLRLEIPEPNLRPEEMDTLLALIKSWKPAAQLFRSNGDEVGVDDEVVF